MPRRRRFYKSLTDLQIALIKNKTHLKYLPPDIIKIIAAMLSFDDFCKFKLSCKYVYQALKIFKLFWCNNCEGQGCHFQFETIVKRTICKLHVDICQICLGRCFFWGIYQSIEPIPLWKIYDIQPNNSIPAKIENIYSCVDKREGVPINLHSKPLADWSFDDILDYFDDLDNDDLYDGWNEEKWEEDDINERYFKSRHEDVVDYVDELNNFDNYAWDRRWYDDVDPFYDYFNNFFL